MKAMTVCIAAACCNGEFVISATDGALSQSGETFDLAVTKMVWFDDWQFMYAGTPSDADLILQNVRDAIHATPHALSSQNIQRTVRQAFKKRQAQWTADYVLSGYDMEMDEFKRKGRTIFGDKLAAEMATEMKNAAELFNEQLMVVGWGRSPIGVMIYGVNRDCAWSGSFSGIGAIGAGGDVARASLLAYGTTRTSSFEEALYAVAAAKFSAERVDGVGKRHTAIHVSRARRPSDKKGEHIGEFIPAEEISALKAMWREHGRLRIPGEVYPVIMRIAQRISGGVSLRSLVPLLQGIARRSGAMPSTSQTSTDQQ
jgi:hypothetical protein